VVIDVSGNTLACVMVALMCLDFRGLASPYAHGVSCILVARGITLSTRWQQGLLRLGLPAISFPLTLLGSMVLLGRSAQLRDPQSLAIFAQNLIWILSSAGLLIIGSHIVWSLRREISEARSVGRYRLKRRLGGGGMGEVWEAYNAVIRQNVAVKILKPELALSQPTVARFEREVRATAVLRHPNTVRIFDYGSTPDGLWYYAMELLEGETLLAAVQREEQLDPNRTIRIMEQVVRALGEAHSLGVIHRDLKPENLFLSTMGGEVDFVKILDFGIAKLTSAEGATSLTMEGSMMGTPLFMSPEQIQGAGVDARSDIYSLGAVLYFMLTGQPPFGGDVATVLLGHLHGTPGAPSTLSRVPLPAGLDDLVLRCLEKSPARRFASVGELAGALAACQGAAPRGSIRRLAPVAPRPPSPVMAGAETLVEPPPG
jgi:serine/threonine-protein kinase